MNMALVRWMASGLQTPNLNSFQHSIQTIMAQNHNPAISGVNLFGIFSYNVVRHIKFVKLFMNLVDI